MRERQAPPAGEAASADESPFETGCRRLQARLHRELKGLSLRIDNEELDRNRIAGERERIAAGIFLQLGDRQRNPPPVDGPVPGRTNTGRRFERLHDDLNTLETETLAALMRQSIRTADSLVRKEGAGPETPGKPREERFRAAEKTMGQVGPAPAETKASMESLGRIIRDRDAPFSEEHRRKLLVMHSLVIELADLLDSLPPKVKVIFDSYNGVCGISNLLEKVLALCWRRRAAQAALRAAKEALQETRRAGPASPGDGPRPSTRTEWHLQELSAELDAAGSALKDDEARMERLLEHRRDLLPAVTAILRNIRLLCGESDRADPPEATVWKVRVAARKWPALKGTLTADCELSGTDPRLVERAFDFLGRHEEFLEAYNGAERSRRRSATLSAEIEVLREAVRDIQRTRSESPERSMVPGRLTRAISEAEREAELATRELDAVMEKVCSEAGYPRTAAVYRSVDIWIDLWIRRCEPTILRLKKALDLIEGRFAEADGKIAGQT